MRIYVPYIGAGHIKEKYYYMRAFPVCYSFDGFMCVFQLRNSSYIIPSSFRVFLSLSLSLSSPALSFVLP